MPRYPVSNTKNAKHSPLAGELKITKWTKEEIEEYLREGKEPAAKILETKSNAIKIREESNV